MNDEASHHHAGSRGFVPDQDMLYHYIQRKLSPADEERVELWLMDHPEAVEDLELDLALQQGMKEIRPKAPTRARRDPPRWIIWLANPAFAGATAFALLAAIATPAGLYLAASDRNQSLTERLQQPRGAIVVDLTATRGSGSDANVTVSDDDVDVVFRVFVPRSTYASYRVRITSGQQVIDELPNQIPGLDGSLGISVPASKLRERFELRVFGEQDGTVTELDAYTIETS